MYSIDFSRLIPILGGILYSIVAIIDVRRHGFKASAGRGLLPFLVLSTLWSLTEISARVGWVDLLTNDMLLRSGRYYVLLSDIAFLYMSFSILRFSGRKRYGFALCLVWLITFLGLDNNLLALQDPLIRTAIGVMGPREVGVMVLIMGWGILMGSIVTLSARASHQSAQPLLQNRANYWAFALIFFVISDGLLVSGSTTWGNVARWLGTSIAASVIILRHVPHIRYIERQISSYLLMTILTAIVLTISLFFVSPSFGQIAEQNPTLIGAISSLVLAAILSVLWVFSQRIINRLLPTDRYDPNHILREYSQGVSSILDPKLLAVTAVGIISEAIDIQRGFLFIVDHEIEDGRDLYRLRGAKSSGDTRPEPGSLASNSPIVEFFLEERSPLRESDINLQTRFERIAPEERGWLSSLEVNIYLPVFSQEDWIGLIALGPKNSGLPYYDSDLKMLGALADQTAVALQNARLVESLMRLNNDFRRAYAAMEQANRHLKEANLQLANLDRTKSDFINVASHELRTPLTIMRGYTEMLLEDPALNANAFNLKLVQGILSGMSRLQEIVGSMLDIASIDARTLELQMEPVSLHKSLETTCDGFAETLKERNLTLEFEDLDDLPRVEADPEALRKVFYHVMINAIKYTPDGGKITVRGTPVSPGQCDLHEGGVKITVSDTGIGIDPEHLETIFTKFYQTGELALHSTGKTKFKGAGPGLGLAIARGIVQAHKGKIWAESPGYDEEKNPGSQFHIALPLHYRE